MTLLFISFIAGTLTVLAPCILPLLPVVLGSSAQGHSRYTPYVVILSLGVSIILFTFALKVSTAFIAIPQTVWTSLSGGILVVLGITLFFPALWEQLPGIRRISVRANRVLGKGYTKKSFLGDVLVGASLGPVFSTCSPTYFVILATVLPASYLIGSVYLFAYVVGLSLVLLLISLLGEKITSRMGKLSDNKGYFKKLFALICIVIGLLIITGFDKRLETALLDRGFFDVTKIEYILLNTLEDKQVPIEVPRPTLIEVFEDSTAQTCSDEGVCTQDQTTGDVPQAGDVTQVASIEQDTVTATTLEKQPGAHAGERYVEFVNPSGFVNTGGKPIRMSDFVGKDIVLVEVMTYSCINCQRTFPYMNTWHEKYADEGLTVIGLHTPEFAFEKNIENVEKAMGEFGIEFPVVLDNAYETWNAYGNRFWPRRYLIDLEGNIVYDHIGEGAYEETEAMIVELLQERKEKLSIE